MTSDDDQDNPRKSLINQLRVIEVKATSEETAAGPVMAMRAYIVAIDPTLKDSITLYIDQIKGLSYEHLRAIESDPEDACRELEIRTGNIKPVTLSSLAKGVHDERKSAEEHRFSWEQLLVITGLSVVLSAFLAWLVTFLAVGGR